MAKKKDAIQKTDVDESLYLAPDEVADDGFGDDSDFITMPIVSLLQSNSPAVEDERAKAGQWWHTVTEIAYDAPLFVPSLIQRVYGEFTPRDDGGGFHGHHAADSEVVKRALAESTEFGKFFTPDGHELIDTFHLYGVLCDDSQPIAMAVVLIKRTAIKPFRAWRNRLRMYRLLGKRTPLSAHLTRLSAVKRKNEKGSFYVPSFSPALEDSVFESLLRLDDSRRIGSEEVRNLVLQGNVRVEHDQDDGEISEDDRAKIRAEDADAFG
jgi:hypothetical protein